MSEVKKYTPPRLVKGDRPKSVPHGSTLKKEWAKNTWYVNYSYEGKQVRVKGGLNRIKDPIEKQYQADVLLLSITEDLKNGFNPHEPEVFALKVLEENITIEEAVERYLQDLAIYARPKTVQSYCSKLRYFIEAFPGKQISSFTPKQIEQYIQNKIHSKVPAKIFVNGKSFELKRPIPWTQNTVRSAKGVFRAFFQWCIYNQFFLEENPVSKIEAKKIRSEVAPKLRNIPFTKEDCAKIMEYLDQHEKLTAFFCRFINSTCMRPGEISQLTLKDIDLDNRQIMVPLSVTKNTKAVTRERIDIEDNLMLLLQNLNLHKYPSEYFLMSNSETIVGDKSFDSNKAYKRFGKALKALNLTDIGYNLYSFKHYSNIQRYNSGWTLLEMMKANRHSSIAMTEKYLKDINRQTDISCRAVPTI